MSNFLTTYDMIPDAEPVTCKWCGWSGLGRDLSKELFSAVVEVNCPKCDGRFQLLSFPTEDEVDEAASKGNPDAIKDLARIRSPQNLRRRAAPTIRSAQDVPAGPDGTFSVVIDGVERDHEGNHDPELFIIANDVEIWREPMYWEDCTGVVELIDALTEAYGERITSLELGSGALLYAAGDRISFLDDLKAAIDRVNRRNRSQAER